MEVRVDMAWIGDNPVDVEMMLEVPVRPDIRGCRYPEAVLVDVLEG